MISDKFIKSYKLFYARRMAKKYKLDFKHGCVFDHQLRYPKIGEGLVRVEMESGRSAEYKAIITKCHGDTGQKSWLFEFQRFLV